MNIYKVKLSLFLNYFVFAILLNSVGTVILQVINSYDVSKESASILEGFKDISIAVVSFAVASFLPRIGMKKSMLGALALVMLACLAMPFIPGFFATKMLFLAIGISFAIIKVSVYTLIGTITTDRASHGSLLNTVEGIFMVGVLSGYWIFSWFIDPQAPDSLQWLNVYWLLAALCLINLVVLFTTTIDESEIKPSSSSMVREFTDMGRLMMTPMISVFVISAFLYVLIEQSLGTWLPTFNNEVLKLPTTMSIQVTSIFAAAIAIGRLSAGVVMKRIAWYPLLNFCVFAMAGIILLTLPLTKGIVDNPDVSWSSAPLAAFLLPLAGLFMAPIYPAINSVILSSLPKNKHSMMTGLIVLFSALGGTTGSLITGQIFAKFDGQTAFYLTLVPLTGILISLYFLNKTASVEATPAGVTEH